MNSDGRKTDMKRKRPRIDHFFKPIGSSSQPDVQPSEENDQGPENDPNNVEIDAQIDTDISDIPMPEVTEQATIITTPYDRDPGRRLQIWELPPDKQNDARRFYISEGPYQPKLDEYPFTGTGSSRRRFQSSWFTNFSWLEYSPHTREVHKVHNFFQNANFIVNTVSASPKRNDELLQNQAIAIAKEIELGELDTGRGLNQIGSLQRAGDTRWSSHYKSVKSLLKLFGASVAVLRSVANDRSVHRNSRGDAEGALKFLVTFDFVFILHLMEKIMQITDVLCVKLQNKSLDIANALDIVSNTKVLLAELREGGWESHMEEVEAFCLKHEIDIPDMNERYVDVKKSRNKHDNTTVLHHYKVDVFNTAIDQQLTELNDRFSSQVTELLDLCTSLDPRHNNFDKSRICMLVEKFYPADFSSQERDRLLCELPHFQLDTSNHPEIKNYKSLADLTKGIIKTGKSSDYPMVERLLRLVLTLPVSTATAERAFSAMKLVKTRLRTKLGDDFLRDCVIVYIEREIAEKFSVDEIIETFDLGARKAEFKLIDM